VSGPSRGPRALPARSLRAGLLLTLSFRVKLGSGFGLGLGPGLSLSLGIKPGPGFSLGVRLGSGGFFRRLLEWTLAHAINVRTRSDAGLTPINWPGESVRSGPRPPVAIGAHE
jgi:hypothetical protein